MYKQKYNPLSDSFNLIPTDIAAGLHSGPNPPADTAQLWFNTDEEILYFYDGSDWLSVQVYEITFNERGSTPNNTFFRIGNTTTNDTGDGFVIEFDAKIEGLSFSRSPNAVPIGNFWLYSNSVTGTDFASVVGVFTVGTVARGFLQPNNPTNINAGSYIAMRWNGQQSSDNIVSLKYRKIYN